MRSTLPTTPSSKALLLLLLPPALFAVCTSAAAWTSADIFFVAEELGSLVSLALARDKASDLSTANITIAYTSNECAPNPGNLIKNDAHDLLYCADRNVSALAVNGSFNSFNTGTQVLRHVERTPVPSGLNGGCILGWENEARGVASVAENRSAIAITIVGDDGQLFGPQQLIFPNITKVGPVANRQERSHLYGATLDPQKLFFATNDLGGDMVRLVSYDIGTVAPVKEVSQLITDPGAGPRSGTFWAPLGSGLVYYTFVGELSQKIYTYAVTYTGIVGTSGMTWKKVYESPSLGQGNERPAFTAPPLQLIISPDNLFIVVLNRDVSLAAQDKPSDTFSIWSLNTNGSLTLIQLAPTGGWWPSDVSINQAGDLLVVGHKINNTAVVWQRDVTSGLLVGPGQTFILDKPVSSVIWDDIQ